MVFSSLTFLCIFFPLVFLLHTAIPNGKVRNGILVAASLVFYAYGEPVFLLLMLLSVLANYFFGLLLEKKNRPKLWLWVTVLFNLGMLAVFKYTDFLLSGVNLLLPDRWELPLPGIRLPIGISFYTFQALSYVIDVYRGEVKAQKNFGKLLLYISFFPQLIAGPIVKYHDIEREISERRVTPELISQGLFRFCCGLAKKVFLANTLAVAADAAFGLDNGAVTFVSAWTGAICYTLQIYFDFSGYSDMAIGLGKIFGFHFLENFNYPYLAGSIREFWRRWHISLSTWFRDYLYIPLGGNRKGKGRTVCNKLIVFLATGIWHGANLTFLLWGLYHGLLMMLEEWNVIPVKKGKNVFGHVYTLLAVVLGFVLFRADNPAAAGAFYRAMFGFGARGGQGLSLCLSLLTPSVLTALVFALVGATPLAKNLADKLENKKKTAGAVWVVKAVLCVLCLVFAIMVLASDSYNPFIYYRF